MDTVLIRADGSLPLGMGHITRCLALAYAFEESGFRPVFVCKEYDSRVGQRIVEAGYMLCPLPPILSLQEDASRLRNLAMEHDAFALVIDLSNTEATAELDAYTEYLHSLANRWPTVILDDLTRATFPEAVVVNPNAGVDPVEYDLKYRPLLLMGPKYALLHPAFRNVAVKRISRPSPVKTVAVSLGGGGVAHATLRTVVRGIYDGLGPSIDVRVVTGLDGESALRASENPSILTRQCTILTNLPNLAAFFAEADIGIVSGGVTKYEAAATGTPAIMVAQVEHQVSWARAFEQTGAAIYAGFAPELTASVISDACCRLRDNASLRQRMAETGASLVDGWGASRVVKAIASV